MNTLCNLDPYQHLEHSITPENSCAPFQLVPTSPSYPQTPAQQPLFYLLSSQISLPVLVLHINGIIECTRSGLASFTQRNVCGIHLC